jgi:UDP-GlcNAc:undecaprenyl-phosphate/decaprenyl-phosphate GlcNAc-1-phosphate transferase
MIVLYVFLGSVVAGILSLAFLSKTLDSPTLSRTNFRGVKLPTAAGLVFVPAFLVVYLVTVQLVEASYTGHGWSGEYGMSIIGMQMMLVLVLGFCLIGFIDDVAGDSGAKGFRGHFSEAFRGRFTTGLVKALMGLVVAAVALQSLEMQMGHIAPKNYGILILDAAIVALSANFFNLLDLRPGRALKVFFPAVVVLAGLTLRYMPFATPVYEYVTPALSVAAIALVLFRGDLREKFMLGDAGSNVLGATVGLGIVIALSFWWRVGALAVVLALNVLSEKYSFSKAIEKNRVLRWIDGLGTKGEVEAADNNR